MAKGQNEYGKDPFGLPFEKLPTMLPIFPLPGAILLPGGHLPLNIFEPRYLEMTLDSLQQSRLIGMVQPLDLQPDPMPTEAALFHIGCAGRITAFAESEEGRLLITLQGVCRFKIAAELDEKKAYRQITPDFSDFEADLTVEDPGIEREKLMPILRNYFDLKKIKIDWQQLHNTDDRFLIAMLGMMTPFDYREKQAILAARDLTAMADVIISLMEMEHAAASDTATKH